MKNLIFKYSCVILFFIAVFVNFSPAAFAESNKESKPDIESDIAAFIGSIPDPVAVIGEAEIRKVQLIEEIMPLLKAVRESSPSLDEDDISKMKKAAVVAAERMAERIILMDLAKKASCIPSDEEIMDEFSNIAGGVSLKETEFASKMGVSPASLKKRIGEAIAIRIWMEKEVAPKAKPGEGEIDDFYKNNIERFGYPERFAISHILLRISGDKEGDSLLEAKLRTIAMAVGNSQEEFKERARKISEDERTKDSGGMLGIFSLDEMPTAFRIAAAGLRAGEISGPFKTEAGWHIVRLDSKKEKKVLSLQEMSPKIIKILRAKKTEEIVTALLKKEKERLGFKILWNSK
jgi:hypothetical protein